MFLLNLGSDDIDQQLRKLRDGWGSVVLGGRAQGSEK
jgi:hypothetical protein